MLQPAQPFILGAAPRPSVILRPGLRALPAGVERYKVAGGGSLVVPIATGDTITFTDIEGLQPCEIIARGEDGRCDPQILGISSDTRPLGLQAILAEDGESARRTLAALRRRGIDLGNVQCIRIFGSGSCAGESARFTATRSGVLVVAAPGGKMDAEIQDTATDIELRIRRAAPEKPHLINDLPEPLADPIKISE